MARTSAPKVPGETVQPENEPVGNQPPVVEDQAVSAQVEPDENVSVPKSILDDMQAQLKDLQQQVAAQAKPEAKRANPEAALPDQSEVDVATINLPVLTKQGWLVPEKYGTPGVKVS